MGIYYYDCMLTNKMIYEMFKTEQAYIYQLIKDFIDYPYLCHPSHIFLFCSFYHAM